MRAHSIPSFSLCSYMASLAVLFVACLPASGQLFTVDRGGERADGPLVRFNVAELRALAADWAGGPDESVTLEDFPLGMDGEVVRVDLRLRPIRLASERTRFVLGTGAGLVEYPFDPSSVTLLTGDVPGHAGSHVFLALGERMSVGRVELGPGRASYTISAPSGGMESAEALAVTRTRPFGGTTGMLRAWCGVDDAGGDASGAGEPLPASGPVPVRGMRQVEQRVIADHELFLMLGDEVATFEYMLLVYGAASDIMMRDLKARLDLVEVVVWTEPDPYGPGSPIPGNPPGADITELLSGTRITSAGGRAFLCGTSSEVHGALGYFGDTVNPLIHSHDVRVAAHELGHNVGGPHTHDIGVDQCHIGTAIPQRGTILSYCSQSYSGGDGNSDLRFHTGIQARIAACMATFRLGRGVTEEFAPDCNQNGVWDEDDIAMGVSMDANGNGIPDECEDCNGNMVLDDEDIASGTSLDLNENGVPDECEPDCNGNGVPDDLDIVPGSGAASFQDDFEVDRGWTVENLGATAGDWERAVPINDPNWTWAPAMDSDGSGRCLLTDNAVGESDVDGGGTRITSPAIDISGERYAVRFDYYLSLSTPNSTDYLLVEYDYDDVGNWNTLEYFEESTGGWQTHTEVLSLSQTVRFRFTAYDNNPDGIVEAAIDAFVVAGALDRDDNGNGVLDSCEADCNGNGVSDHLEITADMTLDINRNAVLDSCEDCDGDKVPDFDELDGAGNLWAAVPDEGIIREYHGLTGVLVGDSDAGVLLQPSDVLITADARVLVSSTGDDRVVEFDRRGGYVRDLVAMGSGGLSQPGAMIVSPRGTLLVASTGSDEVLEYDLVSGAFVGTFVSAGSGGLTEPYGLAQQRNGKLLVTSTAGEILEFDRDGMFERVLASGVAATVRDILVLADGSTVVAAESDNVLNGYDAKTGALIGQWNNGTFGLRLQAPWGLAIGPSGEVYVSASGRGDSHLLDPRVHRYGADGLLVYPFVHGLDARLDHPRGIDFLPADGDCNRNLYPDECDILAGYSQDVNGNGVPDECEECYADCDSSTGAGTLDIFDFLCFQDAYVSGDLYADCDGSGGLDVFDFLCFQNAFVVGCP